MEIIFEKIVDNPVEKIIYQVLHPHFEQRIYHKLTQQWQDREKLIYQVCDCLFSLSSITVSKQQSLIRRRSQDRIVYQDKIVYQDRIGFYPHPLPMPSAADRSFLQARVSATRPSAWPRMCMSARQPALRPP